MVMHETIANQLLDHVLKQCNEKPAKLVLQSLSFADKIELRRVLRGKLVRTKALRPSESKLFQSLTTTLLGASTSSDFSTTAYTRANAFLARLAETSEVAAEARKMLQEEQQLQMM